MLEITFAAVLLDYMSRDINVVNKFSFIWSFDGWSILFQKWS